MTKLLPNAKLLILLLFISILIIALDSFGILYFPKKGILYIANPISFGLYKTSQGIGRQFHFIFASRYASQENKALKEQLGELISENTSLRRRLAEAESQLNQFKFISPSTYNLVPARPIGFSRYLKIDRGSDFGIKVGQAVVAKDNYIGRIKEVSSKGAVVQTLTDPDSKIAAFSQGLEGGSKGVVVGSFGTEALMEKILHEETINIDDLIYSDGTEGFLPRGLLLGKVVEVLDKPNEVFKSAKIKPIFEIGDLELVFVIVE